MLFCSQKGRKVSQRGERSEKMVNIKNEMGKEGPNLGRFCRKVKRRIGEQCFVSFRKMA